MQLNYKLEVSVYLVLCTLIVSGATKGEEVVKEASLDDGLHRRVHRDINGELEGLCEKLLDISAKNNLQTIFKHPNFIGILQECKSYYQNWMFKRGSLLKAKGFGLRTKFLPSRRGGSGLRTARRLNLSHKDEENHCEILLYPKTNFQGTPKRFFASKRFINPREKSLRTFGNCCWKLFASSKRSNRNHKIVAGNAEYKNPSEWKGIPSSTKRITRVDNC
ncbi:uncharacterized protein [Lepeophtheirus salmonis]|uniref:uncharacterized protein isoform X1 n=1 Tax=Lepeophtheirus salmonis TaxID=72036 RepID=UPI001AE5E2AF|nr:uncharacterized protein LOC121114984 isoform X1 [Lepeophtheirus salmonis]